MVRYADSSGFEYDITIENAWRYRDYVIKAFNEDKPYNQFIIEQLAGDELDHPTYDSLTATTLYRIGPRVRFREKNYPSYRYDYMDDMVRTTFQGFMGLSVNCARCHDHKFDPITRMDYYRSVAAFWSYVEYDHPLAPKEKVDEYERIKKQLENEITPLQQEIARIEKPYREKQREQQIQDALKKFPEDIQIAIKTPADKRTPGQKLLVAQVLISPEDANPDMIVADLNATAKSKAAAKANQVFGVAGGEGYKRARSEAQPRGRSQAQGAAGEDRRDRGTAAGSVADRRRRSRRRLPADTRRPGRLAPSRAPDGRRTTSSAASFPQPGQKYEVPPVYFAAAGDDIKFNESTFPVQPGFLQVLSQRNAAAGCRSAQPARLCHQRPPPRPGGSDRFPGQSADRARDGQSDLGLALRHRHRRTPGNFGKMGDAAIESGTAGLAGYRVRAPRLEHQADAAADHELGNLQDGVGVLSAPPTWRRIPPTSICGDSRSSASKRRSSAISVLDASGELESASGRAGRSSHRFRHRVRADQPRGIWELTKEGPDTWRRSVYAYVKRGLKYPMFEVYDVPDLNITCERRAVSTVPTQALTMLNNEFMLIQADHFAQRVLKEAGSNPAEQVKTMYRIALSREPTRKELR